MAYVVSARKYRPQRFEEVVGQEHVTSTIKNALLHDKLAHAFLFCGPRGVGKTTCARLLAKVINMPDPKAAIQDGSYADSDIDISLNIVELDAASNNSVENIRTLIEQVRFQPQQGAYKVFIIDEVHMLSQAAFNAFLKTLEEPPPYAIFILATTERHKILPTILSRCQLYDFRRIQVEDIISQLESIAQKESIKTEHDALYIIAEKADGAMRDALSIYDRIASASPAGITTKAVVDNLNILDFDHFFKAVDLIMSEDAAGLLLLMDGVLKSGFEGDTFVNGLARHLRYLLYAKQSPTQTMLQMSDQLKEKYISQSEAVGYSTIITALDIANEADLSYPKAKDKRLHIEISLLKMCYAGRKVTVDNRTAPSSSSPEKKKIAEADVIAKEINPAPPSRKVETPVIKEKPKESPELDKTKTPTTPQLEKEESLVVDFVEKTGDSLEVEKTSSASSIVNTPTLSNVEDLLKEAAASLAQDEEEKTEVNIADIEQIWEDYRSNCESPTTSGILKNVIKKVEGDKVHVYVPTNRAREEIQQETELYTSLREHFRKPDLSIIITVDRDQFPDLIDNNQKKLVTPKEKYDHLKAINPLIEDLIEKLDLKLDE